MSPLRTFFKALAIALIGAWGLFFFGIFVTLIAMLIIAQVTGSQPDLTISYRIVGATAGVTAFILGFVGSIVHDLRRASAAK